MELKRDRLGFLLRVFVHGPGLTQRALESEAGVSSEVLRPGYEAELRPETVGKIARAAARLLHQEEKRLLAWLYGERDDELQAWFAELLHLVECVRCRDWFPDSQITKALSLCGDCVRETGRANMFKRRLAKNPELAKFYEELDAAKPRIQREHPPLFDALRKLDGEAITRPKVARLMGISVAQVLALWRDLALPIKIFLAGTAGLSPAASPPSAATAAAPWWWASGAPPAPSPGAPAAP